MKKSACRIKSVPMYDLFSRGNYIGSYRRKSDAEGEILRRIGTDCVVDRDGPNPESRLGTYLSDMRFTVVRSLHYGPAGGPGISKGGRRAISRSRPSKTRSAT